MLVGHIGPKSPSIGYAPPEYRMKPWPAEAQIAGWFPALVENMSVHTSSSSFADAVVIGTLAWRRPHIRLAPPEVAP